MSEELKKVNIVFTSGTIYTVEMTSGEHSDLVSADGKKLFRTDRLLIDLASVVLVEVLK